MTGTDLTQIDGIDVMTAATIISEVGWDMSKWKNEDHFVSWLRLCPDNRISGNKIIGKGRLPTNNRVSVGLKMAASYPTGKQHLSRSPVSPIPSQAGRSRRDQGYGGQAGPIGVPHATLRDEVRGSRSEVLRGPKPQPAVETPKMEGRQARIPTRPSSSCNLTHREFLGSEKQNQVVEKIEKPKEQIEGLESSCVPRRQTHNFDVTDGAPSRFERHHVGRRAGTKPTQCSTADMSAEVWSSFGAI